MEGADLISINFHFYVNKFAEKPEINSEEFNDYIKNRNKALRKALLSKLLYQIENGNYTNISTDINRLYPQFSSVRKEYKSPAERSTHNYGYMDSSEMGAGTKYEF